MIDLYTWTTPNGRKVSIMLEEVGLPYEVIPVNLGEGGQLTAEFGALNPNRRIPVVVDHDAPGGPLPIIESGAILVYLAEKTGRFLAAEVRARSEAVQWLMFQMGGIGPMMGQAGHFANAAPERIPYAIQRYVEESVRLIEVLNARLGGREFLAGEYSIADMATYPWVQAGWEPLSGIMTDRMGALGDARAWLDRMAARPAVARGMQVPEG